MENHTEMKLNVANLMKRSGLIAFLAMALQGCTGLFGYPGTVMPGDTVSIMFGGSESARKATINVSLEQNGVIWDLHDPNGDLDTSDSLVRSVFNLLPDPRAKGISYGTALDTAVSWEFGHEPTQSVLIVDMPGDLVPGLPATLTISDPNGTSDDSSGAAGVKTYTLNVVADPDGDPSNNSDQFMRKDLFTGSSVPVDFTLMEPAAHAKIAFGTNQSTETIYAVELDIPFDNIGVDGAQLHVHIPEAKIGGFAGVAQRMAYWRLSDTGDSMLVDILAPNGIQAKYLKVYVMSPDGSVPAFQQPSFTFYNEDGADVTNTISSTPTLVFNN